MSAAKTAAADTARGRADEKLAQILAAEAAASPDQLRAYLADTRQMLPAKDREVRQLSASLTQIGAAFGEVLWAHIQRDPDKLVATLNRIVASNIVVMKDGVTVPPAGERMQ